MTMDPYRASVCAIVPMARPNAGERRPPPGRVDNHPQHPDLRQPQPHRHNISRHRGPPGSTLSPTPIPAGPRPSNAESHPPPPPPPPHPNKRRSASFLVTVVVVRVVAALNRVCLVLAATSAFRPLPTAMPAGPCSLRPMRMLTAEASEPARYQLVYLASAPT